MQVLRAIQRLLKPRRVGDLHALLAQRGRRGREEVAVRIIQRNVFDIADIGAIE
ncbi:hypothetical protein SDC9_192809 [bioreactor metagenome]|uniref:Uncharacterized protein n=1 Tax=bioreactor metagenome TaxID=1076179 RepID=A0A645I387_9ZZZZ